MFRFGTLMAWCAIKSTCHIHCCHLQIKRELSSYPVQDKWKRYESCNKKTDKNFSVLLECTKISP